MGNIRRRHSAALKSKVALELIIGAEPTSAICSKYSIHPGQAKSWKAKLTSSLPDIFDKQAKSNSSEKDELIEELYKQIGQLKVELDWVKKKSSSF